MLGLWACENCGSVGFGEGKAQKALSWVSLGPCPSPQKHVEMEVPCEVLSHC